MIFLISQWENRELVLLYPGLRTRKWQSQDSNPDLKTKQKVVVQHCAEAFTKCGLKDVCWLFN